MVALIVISTLFNLVGIIACHSIARSRGSKKVVFWTTMGIIFGPFAIPFVLRATRKSVPNGPAVA
jgi:hypothetical protein